MRRILCYNCTSEDKTESQRVQHPNVRIKSKGIHGVGQTNIEWDKHTDAGHANNRVDPTSGDLKYMKHL